MTSIPIAVTNDVLSFGRTKEKIDPKVDARNKAFQQMAQVALCRGWHKRIMKTKESNRGKQEQPAAIPLHSTPAVRLADPIPRTDFP